MKKVTLTETEKAAMKALKQMESEMKKGKKEIVSTGMRYDG